MKLLRIKKVFFILGLIGVSGWVLAGATQTPEWIKRIITPDVYSDDSSRLLKEIPNHIRANSTSTNKSTFVDFEQIRSSKTQLDNLCENLMDLEKQASTTLKKNEVILQLQEYANRFQIDLDSQNSYQCDQTKLTDIVSNIKKISGIQKVGILKKNVQHVISLDSSLNPKTYNPLADLQAHFLSNPTEVLASYGIQLNEQIANECLNTKELLASVGNSIRSMPVNNVLVYGYKNCLRANIHLISNQNGLKKVKLSHISSAFGNVAHPIEVQFKTPEEFTNLVFQKILTENSTSANYSKSQSRGRL